MTVAFDAEQFRTLTPTGGTWTHTCVGASRGLAVLIAQTADATDLVTAVSYAGATLTRVTNGHVADTVTEPCGSYLYFKGTVALSGTVNVVKTASTGSTVCAWSWSFTGNQAQLEFVTAGSIGVDTANPSVTLPTTAADSGFALSVFSSGLAAPDTTTIVTGAGFTRGTGTDPGGKDWGANCAVAQYGYFTGANIAVGWNTAAVSDDCAMIGAFVREVAPAISTFPDLNAAYVAS